MSASKNLFFGKLPSSHPAKAELLGRLEEKQERLSVRIPTRRKNPLFGRRWDPLWPSCLRRAATELGIETLPVNDGLFVATDLDKERVTTRAQELWEHRSAGLRVNLGKRKCNPTF